MKKRLISLMLVATLASSSTHAASACPYHWWLGLVAATETVIAYFPDARRPVRIMQAAATGSIVLYAIKRTYDQYYAQAEKQEN